MQQYIDFLSNHPYLTAAWVALFLALIVSWIKSLTSSVKQISPTQLTLMVNREDATVIDIRAEADFKKGHITGARHLTCLLYTSPSPRDVEESRMPSSA